MSKLQLSDPQQSIRLRKAVLSYLIDLTPRALYRRQIEDHLPEYRSNDIAKAVRDLCRSGHAKQMQALIYATDKGRAWARLNIVPQTLTER